jgi:thiosulfate dehydrogenase [quinone] large subunit
MSDSVQTRLLGRDVSFEVSGTYLAYWLVMMRVVGGWWMLHAGLDKIWAWPFDASWFVGGQAAGTSLGPFVTLFDSGVLLDVVNVAIPLGQTAIGLGLILGAFTRTAAFFGAVLLMFFFFINGETGAWAHGVVTAELLGIVVYGTIISLGAGRVLGVDAYLAETDLVQSNPRLQYLVG